MAEIFQLTRPWIVKLEEQQDVLRRHGRRQQLAVAATWQRARGIFVVRANRHHRRIYGELLLRNNLEQKLEIVGYRALGRRMQILQLSDGHRLVVVG